MPKVTELNPDKVSIEEIRMLLNKHQGFEPVGELFGVSGKTVRRFVGNKLKREYCWKRVTVIDATVRTDTEAQR